MFDIQRIDKRNNKLIKKYPSRLCEVTTLTYPFLSKKKLTLILVDILKTLYYEYLIDNLSTHFMNMMTTTEKIEQSLKSRRIRNPSIAFGSISKDKSKYGLQIENPEYYI
jgi:hypothetical protein